MIEVRHYITRAGRDVVGDWLTSIRDVRTRAKIAVRIDRLSVGNFGDCKSLRRGLYELRIHSGPGFRVYYTTDGQACILLLCGGDKGSQSADIERAFQYLEDFRQRKEEQ